MGLLGYGLVPHVYGLVAACGQVYRHFLQCCEYAQADRWREFDEAVTFMPQVCEHVRTGLMAGGGMALLHLVAHRHAPEQCQRLPSSISRIALVSTNTTAWCRRI